MLLFAASAAAQPLHHAPEDEPPQRRGRRVVRRPDHRRDPILLPSAHRQVAVLCPQVDGGGDLQLDHRRRAHPNAGPQVVPATGAVVVRRGGHVMCCGAGGARMFMEEHIGKQVNVERSQELLATGAERIATACPYCYIMVDDGVKAQGVEDDQVKVGDIALHLLEALENAESPAQPPITDLVEG